MRKRLRVAKSVKYWGVFVDLRSAMGKNRIYGVYLCFIHHFIGFYMVLLILRSKIRNFGAIFAVFASFTLLFNKGFAQKSQYPPIF